jgi:hypothetical protein
MVEDLEMEVSLILEAAPLWVPPTHLYMLYIHDLLYLFVYI